METGLAVASAFEQSRPFVESLSSYRGPSEPPAAEIVDSVCRSLWDRKGKRLRSHLVHWFGDMAGVAPETLQLYAWAAEAVHTASLLHDDVIDRAEVRRGEPSANALFGNTLPILSGDYLLSDAVLRVAERGEPRLLVGLCGALKDLVCGESMQHEFAYTIPRSDRAYWRIAELKTTALLRWAATVGPELAGSPWKEAVHRFMTHFGTLFQFSDDVLDVIGSEDKEAWVDLREGKLNFVSWRLVRSDPRLEILVRDAFSKKMVSAATVRQCERRVDGTFLKEVRGQIEGIAENAIDELAALPSGMWRRAAEGLVRLCVDRTR